MRRQYRTRTAAPAYGGVYEIEHLERGPDGHLLGGADRSCTICIAADPEATARRLWASYRDRITHPRPWAARFDERKP